ncbi:MAG: coenzyme F420-0:L-glutamate ligase [Brachybacterium tyrofermentans]|uniref:coenzyme F420-0:L-glutamate ligase n=1 Tax=Brachybacterium tyrofermentans TaxID=47848 RepID=UPI003FB742A4
MTTSPHRQASAAAGEQSTVQPATWTPSRPVPGQVNILPVLGIGEIRAGDDLAGLLLPALQAMDVQDGDVLCVSTKIVSKALGLRVDPEHRDAAVDSAAVRTVARRRHTRVVTSVVQIASGPVMAAAGVDSSNAPDGPLLLPEDPDACARDLHRSLSDVLGIRIGVLLTDTSSRIWRVGVGDIALGAAGVTSLQDLRGGADADGRALTVTVRNLADELAAAADLVKGKASGVPAALVRGVHAATDGAVPARELSRTGEDDWFRRPSLESVWVALGLEPHQEPIARMSPEPVAERIDRALAVAAIPRHGDPGHRAVARLVPAPGTASSGPDRSDGPGGPDGLEDLERLGGPALSTDARIEVVPAGPDPENWIAAGSLAERIRVALGAESLGAALPTLAIDIVRPEIPEDHR